MEDMKTQINYMLEKIKKELKNNMPLITDPNQQLLFLNQKLDEIYKLGLDKKDVKICNTIIKYDEEQRKLEDQVMELQGSMLKNKDNILDNIMREL